MGNIDLLLKAAEELVESKICANDTCKKVFTRGKNEADALWERKKYCSTRCRLRMNNKIYDQNARTRKKNPPVAFNEARAAEIADEKIDDMLRFLSAFVDDEDDLPKYKAFAMKVCIDCQRAAFDEMI